MSKELIIDDKQAWLTKWCEKNKLELIETTTTFGKPLLTLADYTFDKDNPIKVAFEWWDEELLEKYTTDPDAMTSKEFEYFDRPFGRLDSNGEVPCPELHYDKSYTKYVQLSNSYKTKALEQMFTWLLWFTDNGFTLERRQVSKEEYLQALTKGCKCPITFLKKKGK